MTGFCEACGKPVENCRCPSGYTTPARKTKTGPLILPKATTHRRLLGSGIEYVAYVLGAWLITFLDFFSAGLMGLLCLLLAGLIVLRDCNAGAFSIAKRISNMRVVDWRTGQPASNAQALARNGYYLGLLLLALLPLVDWVTSPFFTLFVALDVIMIMANPKGRRLGDFLAGTQVVDLRS